MVWGHNPHGGMWCHWFPSLCISSVAFPYVKTPGGASLAELTQQFLADSQQWVRKGCECIWRKQVHVSVALFFPVGLSQWMQTTKVEIFPHCFFRICWMRRLLLNWPVEEEVGGSHMYGILCLVKTWCWMLAPFALLLCPCYWDLLNMGQPPRPNYCHYPLKFTSGGCIPTIHYYCICWSCSKRKTASKILVYVLTPILFALINPPSDVSMCQPLRCVCVLSSELLLNYSCVSRCTSNFKWRNIEVLSPHRVADITLMYSLKRLQLTIFHIINIPSRLLGKSLETISWHIIMLASVLQSILFIFSYIT